jgi:uncharacterized protein
MTKANEAIEIRVVGGAAEIEAEAWNRVAAGDGAAADGRPSDPFVDHAFFLAVEQSGSAALATGWQPRHLVVTGADGRVAGILPTYAKSHSLGEYVFDHGWAQAWERAGGRYYPKLQASVPFTPVTGPRLLVGPGTVEERAVVKQALVAGLQALTERAGLASAHATFLPPGDAEVFEAAGWAIRFDRQFHFPNRGYRDFDDFLATLLGRKRKQILRERREATAGGLEIVSLTGADITAAHWDAFFAFYQDTGARKWGRPYLTRDFFSRIGRTMADRVLLVLALDGGRPIAGALNFIGGDALYGRWWGALEERPFLHFEVCYYRAIDWAIAHGLSRVEAGAQGEHKVARGYLPSTTRSAHFLADPGFRRAVDRFLAEEREHVAAADAEYRALSPYADRDRMVDGS